MLDSSQIRAARGLLGWKQSDLAKAAGLGLATIQRIEQQPGPPKAQFITVMKIQQALADQGIEFLDVDQAGGIGVRRVIR